MRAYSDFAIVNIGNERCGIFVFMFGESKIDSPVYLHSDKCEYPFPNANRLIWIRRHKLLPFPLRYIVRCWILQIASVPISNDEKLQKRQQRIPKSRSFGRVPNPCHYSDCSSNSFNFRILDMFYGHYNRNRIRTNVVESAPNEM